MLSFISVDLVMVSLHRTRTATKTVFSGFLGIEGSIPKREYIPWISTKARTSTERDERG